MRDASLDEFLSGGDGEDGTPASEADDGDEAGARREAGTADDREGTGTGDGTDPDAEADSERETGPGADDGSETGDQPLADAVEPARSTFAWSPEGGPCAECGEPVEERWAGESGLVCGDCKRW